MVFWYQANNFLGVPPGTPYCFRPGEFFSLFRQTPIYKIQYSQEREWKINDKKQKKLKILKKLLLQFQICRALNTVA